VREICTLRSVGAGARATAPGHPVRSVMVVPTATVMDIARERINLTDFFFPVNRQYTRSSHTQTTCQRGD
jgi:hypothetical protein